jgi:hypothetical protein
VQAAQSNLFRQNSVFQSNFINQIKPQNKKRQGNMSKVKNLFYIIVTFVIIFGGVTGCKENQTTASGSTDTNLVIQIHDAPFLKSGKNVTALNITVEKIEIIRSSDKEHIILSETPQSMDILSINANNPVVLSDTSVAPGLYDQLRLILSEENTITVDGETFPINISSGQQTGVKLNGPFDLPAGKLFKLDLDFDAPRSVIYNKGQGYKLKPVITIVSTGTVVGNFRGNPQLFSITSSSETIFELRDDNTYRMKFSDYPSYTVHGGYYHNSVAQSLTFSINDVTGTEDLDQVVREYIFDQLPDNFTLGVIQWSINDIIVVDIAGESNTLNRIDSFSFSAGYTTTPVTVTVNYNNSSMNGKAVLIQLKPRVGGGRVINETGVLQNGKLTKTIQVPDSILPSANVPVDITAYLANSTADFNLKAVVYGGEYAVDISGAKIIETTRNPWQPAGSSFTIVKSGTNNATVDFPQKMNVRFESFDFTHNHPVAAWDAYPGAAKYFVFVLVRDKVSGGDDNENDDRWDIAFSKVTTSTSETVYSGILNFVPVYATEGGGPSETLQSGEVVRVEVYALDNSGTLNMAARTGALYMDSKNYIIQ